MKKTISILVLVFAITFTTQAQKRHHKKGMQDFTVAQQTTLAVKKMTLKLDLTEKQQRQIKPLLAQKIAAKKAMHLKMKAKKATAKKLPTDERYQMMNNRLDKKIAFKKQMKRILNEEQFKKFKKTAARKSKKFKKKGMRKKMMHKRKMQRKTKKNKE